MIRYMTVKVSARRFVIARFHPDASGSLAPGAVVMSKPVELHKALTAVRYLNQDMQDYEAGSLEPVRTVGEALNDPNLGLHIG
jgi:hypothetical protein